MKSEETTQRLMKTREVCWKAQVRENYRGPQPFLQCSQTMNATQESRTLLVGLCLPVAPDTEHLTAYSPHSLMITSSSLTPPQSSPCHPCSQSSHCQSQTQAALSRICPHKAGGWRARKGNDLIQKHYYIFVFLSCGGSRVGAVELIFFFF